MSGSLLFLGMALLVVLAGLLARRRVSRSQREEGLSDETVRRIEREGQVRFEIQDPLDLDEIRREEDAFWAQTWDEPDPL